MSKAIWKFPLDVNHLVVEMPAGAKVLSAREQHGAICVWAEVDTAVLTKRPRYFEVFGTGHAMPNEIGVERKFVDTVMLNGGELVLSHLRTNQLRGATCRLKKREC